jgi:conjugal transfer pilus assembly protein TraK
MNKRILFTSIMFGLICNNVFAEQIFQAKTGQTINANVSTKELTRIQVSGFPIVKAFTSASIVIKKDPTTGQLYILPNGLKNRFNVFIVDKNGDNFNLNLLPSKNYSGDSIVIIPDGASIKRAEIAKSSDKMQNNNYSRNINEIIQIMYMNSNPNTVTGYEVKDINQLVPMWKNINTSLLRQYSNSALDGYIYSLTNETNDKVILDEAKFYHKGVLAVAIENPSLDVGSSTRVFVVQEHLGD